MSMTNAYRETEDVRVSQAFCVVFKKIIIVTRSLIKGLSELKGLVWEQGNEHVSAQYKYFCEYPYQKYREIGELQRRVVYV